MTRRQRVNAPSSRGTYAGRMPEGLIWSVGHSNHALPALLALLEPQEIEVVADVRSQPFSRFNPQFNRDAFRSAVVGAGLQYVFLGDELGGRPPESELYDHEGHVLYGELANNARFLTGIERLISGAQQFNVAMLCSEEAPMDCHRRLLIARVLAGRGVEVMHIRGDGTTISETDLATSLTGPNQGSLFGEEAPPWRSVRSVSPNTPPKTSLKA